MYWDIAETHSYIIKRKNYLDFNIVLYKRGCWQVLKGFFSYFLYCVPSEMGYHSFPQLPIFSCSNFRFVAIPLWPCSTIYSHNLVKWFTRSFSLLFLSSIRPRRITLSRLSFLIVSHDSTVLASFELRGLQQYHAETLVLMRSSKLSNFELGYYLDNWPLVNTRSCKLRGKRAIMDNFSEFEIWVPISNSSRIRYIPLR